VSFESRSFCLYGGLIYERTIYKLSACFIMVLGVRMEHFESCTLTISDNNGHMFEGTLLSLLREHMFEMEFGSKWTIVVDTAADLRSESVYTILHATILLATLNDVDFQRMQDFQRMDFFTGSCMFKYNQWEKKRNIPLSSSKKGVCCRWYNGHCTKTPNTLVLCFL
jgi:hypothetical protein